MERDKLVKELRLWEYREAARLRLAEQQKRGRTQLAAPTPAQQVGGVRERRMGQCATKETGRSKRPGA
jgi:hypothetical protein